MNEICVDFFWFTLKLNFFAHSLILLMLPWSFNEAIACSSYVANIAVSSAKIAADMFSDAGRSLV